MSWRDAWQLWQGRILVADTYNPRILYWWFPIPFQALINTRQDISDSTSRFDQLSRRMWIHKYRSLGHKSRVEQCSPVLLLGKRHRNWLLELLLKIPRTTKPSSKQIFLRMSIWKLWGIGNLQTKKIHHNATFRNWFVTILLILSTLITWNQTLPSQ